MSSRNSSDIFCLREDITDGTQMFSVNGSCPGKISRRRQLPESDCFEYGRSASRTGPISEEEPGVVGYEEDEEYPAEEPPKRAPEVPASEPKKEERKRAEQIVAASHMTRNPLTGAGMEIKEHKRAKKGPVKKDEWLW